MKKSLILFPLLFALTALGAAEHRVSDVVFGTPPEQRDEVVLATDGDEFLVVWNDSRESALWPEAFEAQASLFAARLTAAGGALDPKGIHLSSQSSGPAHVVWNGKRYLVFFPVGDTIMLATVDGDGATTEAHPVLENAVDISVAANGSRIVIAYEGDRSGIILPRPYVAVFDIDGSLIANGSVATFRHEDLAPSAVAMKSGEFVVAWNAFGGFTYAVNAVRFNAGGARLTPHPIGIGTSKAVTSLHANDDALVAVSHSATWGVSADLLELTTPGNGATGEVFELLGRAAIVSQTFTGNAYPRAITIAPFDEEGHETTSTAVAVAAPAGSSAGRVAAIESNGRLLLAWPRYDADNKLLGTLVDAHLLWMPLTGTFEMTASAPPQFDPAIAAGATESLVAWHELDGVYAARLNDAGRRLDGRGIRLSGDKHSESTAAGAPRVVFHDGRYAVAFSEGTEVVMRFVTPAGDVLPNRLLIGTTQRQRIALASGGGTLFVAWSDGSDVLATRVHPSLTADPPVIVSGDVDMDAVDPAAAWNGTHFLVTWVGTFEFDRTTVRPRLYARRVTPELGLAGASKMTVQHNFGMPAIASDGTDWFVAWESDWGRFASDIYVTRFAASGIPAAENIVARGSAPELVWTGNTLFLAYRPDSGALAVAPVAGDGATETIAGKTRNTTPGVIGYSLPPFEQTGIAWRNGRWIAAYQRISGRDEGFVPRVFAAISGNRSKMRAIR